jgi:hypothetical protein
MTRKRSEPMAEAILLRLQPSEKRAFQDAARASGIRLSSWARERLRRAAIRDLEEIGVIPDFIREITGDE